MRKKLFFYTIAILTIAFLYTELGLNTPDTVTGKFVEIPVFLEDLTSEDISTGLYKRDGVTIRFHLTCINEACVAVEGAGRNRCLDALDCRPGKYLASKKLPAHKGCRQNRCLVIFGEGEDTCSTREDCNTKKTNEPPITQRINTINDTANKTPTVKKSFEEPPKPTLVQETSKSTATDSLLKRILKKLGWLKE